MRDWTESQKKEKNWTDITEGNRVLDKRVRAYDKVQQASGEDQEGG